MLLTDPTKDYAGNTKTLWMLLTDPTKNYAGNTKTLWMLLTDPTKNYAGNTKTLWMLLTDPTRDYAGNTKTLWMLLTDPALRPDREADVKMFLSVSGITTKDQPPGELRNLTLALLADRFCLNSCLQQWIC